MRSVRLAWPALVVAALLCLGGCGSSPRGGSNGGGQSGSSALGLRSHPQVVEPTVGDAPGGFPGGDPVGDPNAHAVSLAEVRRELKIVQELNSLRPGQGVA